MDDAFTEHEVPKHFRCAGTYFLTGLSKAEAFVCEALLSLFYF